MSEKQVEHSAATHCSLPSRCPEHPDEFVEKVWFEKRYVMNGYPSGTGTRSKPTYRCSKCQTELAIDESEFVKV